jgi:hypothetical protein
MTGGSLLLLAMIGIAVAAAPLAYVWGRATRRSFESSRG